MSRALLFVVIAWAFFLYPAWVTVSAVFSREIRETAQSPLLVSDYRSTAGRYEAWASEFLHSQRALHVESEDVGGTEWPMFGSVFFLMTTEELVKRQPNLLDDETVRHAVDLAARVVASPETATWVRTKWGPQYLERENLFYRMLLIMGLGSYEQLTRSSAYTGTLRAQARSLLAELLVAPHHLGDDYPGECYPNDVVWAVAALGRAAELRHVELGEVHRLSEGLFATLNGPALADSGLPSFRVDKDTALSMQPARGSANSGILPLAAELDPKEATKWFEAYVKNFWKSGWVSGFREMPRGMSDWEDVDSGPTLFGVGTVATGFGLGAARSVGRFDYAVPLAMEVTVAAWPTPFGLLLPGTLGWAAADGWCFGELALQFSMTRPNVSGDIVAYDGGVPGMVWVFLGLYLLGAGILLTCAWRVLRGAGACRTSVQGG